MGWTLVELSPTPPALIAITRETPEAGISSTSMRATFAVRSGGEVTGDHGFSGFRLSKAEARHHGANTVEASLQKLPVENAAHKRFDRAL